MGLSDIQVNTEGFRLLPTKYPPILLFGDVSSQEEFEALYALQALTNPRLQHEAGDVSLINPDEIPYHCERGRSYAIAPFTHINRDGSRFADGSFGALYLADTQETALAEVYFHQNKYWQNVEGLNYDRLSLRCLNISFKAEHIFDVCDRDEDDPILDKGNYAAAQALARQLRKDGYQGIQYPSVRAVKCTNWALFTPKPVIDVVQSLLLEMTWDGNCISKISTVEHSDVPNI